MIFSLFFHRSELIVLWIEIRILSQELKKKDLNLSYLNPPPQVYTQKSSRFKLRDSVRLPKNGLGLGCGCVFPVIDASPGHWMSYTFGGRYHWTKRLPGAGMVSYWIWVGGTWKQRGWVSIAGSAGFKDFSLFFAPFFGEDSKPFLLTNMFSKGGVSSTRSSGYLSISSRTPFRKFTNHRKLTS